RRNRTAVALVTAVTLAVVIGVGGLAIGAYLTWQEKEQKVAALQDREAALEKARRRTRFAMAAANEMDSRVAPEWLADQPGLQRLQEKFLLEAARFYDELVREQDIEPEARLEAGSAYLRLGGIQARLGRDKDAEVAYRQAAKLLSRLDEDFPAKAEYKKALAGSLDELGWFLGCRQSPEAEPHHRRALALWQELVGRFPSEDAYRSGQAACWHNLGLLLQKGRRFGDAEHAFQEALNINRRLLDAYAEDPERHSKLGLNLTALSGLHA